MLKQSLLDLFKFLGGLNDEKGKVGVFLIFAIPIFERLQVVLLIHILATFPQLLVVDNVDIRPIPVGIFHSSGNVLQTADNELLIDLFFISIGKKGHFLRFKEVIDEAIRPFPLLL